MFDIWVQRLAVQGTELNNEGKEILQYRDSLDYIVRKLSRQSGMDLTVSKIKRTMIIMEEENTSMRQMTDVLEKTIAGFTGCENWILGNAEQSIIRYQRKNVIANDLSEYSGMLAGINIY